MGKKRSRWRRGLLIVYMFMAVCVLPPSLTVCAQEPQGEEADNPVYDRLKSRIETAWDDGMKQIEETDLIEISGNLVERLLRGIAAGLYRNLQSIKAGSLLAGGDFIPVWRCPCTACAEGQKNAENGGRRMYVYHSGGSSGICFWHIMVRQLFPMMKTKL